jgi:hypothetical protein
MLLRKCDLSGRRAGNEIDWSKKPTSKPIFLQKGSSNSVIGKHPVIKRDNDAGACCIPYACL